VLRMGDARRTAARPGVRIAGGTLVYDGLRTWMGYRVAYDPTLPWLLAAALLAALSLGWHYRSASSFRPSGRCRPAQGARLRERSMPDAMLLWPALALLRPVWWR
jgi:hypothetical protein